MAEALFGKSNRWLTVMLIDPETGVTPADIMDVLSKENIESRPVWKPMHLQPVFQRYAFFSREEKGSISDDLFTSGICLPSGSNLAMDEQKKIIDIISTHIQKNRQVSFNATVL